MENNGIDFPLLIDSPKEVILTKEQFDKLSYMGLASFMVNYPFCIEENENELKLYMHESCGYQYKNYPRFKHLTAKLYSSAELAFFIIPNTDPLFTTLKKYFNHLFLK